MTLFGESKSHRPILFEAMTFRNLVERGSWYRTVSNTNSQGTAHSRAGRENLAHDADALYAVYQDEEGEANSYFIME